MWTFLAVLIGLPLVGLAAYVVLVERMARQQVPDPPVRELFIVFAAYGTLLLFVLTLAAGGYSGMHLRMGFLMTFVATPGLVLQGVRLNRRTGRDTDYHIWALSLSFWLWRLVGAFFGSALSIR